MVLEDLARSFAWLFLLLILGVGTALVVTGELDRRDIAGGYHILVRDSVNRDIHKLSGAVAVDTTCDVLTVRAERVSAEAYSLIFKTWRQPHAVDCRNGATRTFNATILANTQIPLSFSALLNGSPVSVLVVPEIPIAPPGTLNTTSSAQSVR